MGAAPQPREVGPVYDLLLQTRDSTTLACRNADGKLVNIGSVAYMTTIDRNQVQHEETELQHKDRLIQLQANIIDREFDQWIQATQGDWSDGTQQRVLSGGQNLPTKYWDDLGVLWPVNDYVPQRSLPATPDRNENGARMFADFQGVTSGRLLNFTTANVFVYMYEQQAAPQNHILVAQSSVGSKTTFTNPPGTSAGFPATRTLGDFVLAFGLLWWVTTTGGNIQLSTWDGSAGAFTTRFTVNAANVSNGVYARIAAGVAGNKSYIAFSNYANSGGVFVTLAEASSISAGLIIASTNIPVIADPTGVLKNFIVIEQMEFLGNELFIAATDFAGNGYIIDYSIPSQTSAVVARFTQVTALHMVAIAGGLFILAVNNLSQSPTNLPATIDQYLLQGQNLQHIGPVTIPQPGNANPILSATSDPVAFGPYAMFPVVYNPSGQTQPSRVAIFAYDVLRGRTFHLDDLGTYEPLLNTNYGRRGLAVVGPMTHSALGGTFIGQWATVTNVLSTQGSTSDITNVQRSLFSASTTGGAFLQHGVQITSSLIDFTSAQNKLYRQAVVSFTPLPIDPAITVQLDVWLDQDVANLSATPDFTTGAVGTGVNGGVLGQKQLKLLINRVARKLVYRVTTTGPDLILAGPNAGTYSAVKLQSVAIQAATGWVQTLELDLAPNVQSNGKGVDNIFSYQGFDNVAAYNFLRQLWRLKGGEVTATFPNGDSGNWLIQDMHFDSPKPFGTPFRADQLAKGFKWIASLKIREDL